MAEWKKQQRRLEIHRWLKKGRPFTQRVMAERLGVSIKTVERDLQEMQADGLKVEYDPIDETWKYLEDPAEVPLDLMAEEDRKALLFSLYAAGQLEGTPVVGQMRRAYQKLLETLGPDRAGRFEAVMKQVHFAGQKMPGIAREVWGVVLLSMEDRTTMHIEYVDGGYGSATWRDVDPYLLVMRDRRWMLVGWCHWAQEVRTFALHRITKAQTTDRGFQRDAEAVRQYLAAGYGGYSAVGEAKEVVLRMLATEEFVAAHNARFNRSVLEAVCGHFEIGMPALRWVCTCELAKQTWPGLGNHRLGTVMGHLGHTFRHHHALEDAEACGRVLVAMMKERGVRTARELVGA